jgi:L-asparaginase / beta-aspartyl-peptidase
MRASDNRIPGETIMIRTALAAALLSAAAPACMSETGLDGQAAADRVMDELTAIEGDGGIVALIGGQPVWSMNTSGMYRASQTHDGEPYVAIFDDE